MDPTDDSAPNLSEGGPVAGAAASAPAGATDEAERRYREVGLLGAGGMGAVHAVHDARLGRQVARKRPRDGLASADEAIRREARLTALLEHPGIVPVYDAGHDASGRPWYTMRLIRGRTLREVAREASGPSARLALVRAVLAAVQAVAYAHARGVVHCDIKTSNILLGEHGEVQVIDWGLATSAPVPGGGGTPSSMAPEQARGEPATPRSDVWSLGLVLYEALSGERLVSGSTPGKGGEGVSGPPPALPAVDVPSDLRAILQRCLQPDPADRYPDAGALARDLESFLDGRLVEAHDYTSGELLLRWILRYRLAVSVAALAVGVVAVLGTAATIRVVRERNAAVAAEQRANEARSQSDANLARALVLAARASAGQLARPEAEVLAAGALVLAESPEARGILAGFAASPRPSGVPAAVPACDGTLIAGPEGLTACHTSEAVRVAAQGRALHEHAGAFDAVAFAGTSLVLARHHDASRLVDARTGAPRVEGFRLRSARPLHGGRRFAMLNVGPDLFLIDPHAGPSAPLRPCGDEAVIEPAEVADGAIVLGCGLDRLVRYEPTSGAVVSLVDPIPARRAAYRAIIAAPDGSIAVGTQAGELGVVRPDGRSVHLDLGVAIERLVWADAADRLIVEQNGLGPMIVDIEGAVPIVRLPAADGVVIEAPHGGGIVFHDGHGWRVGDVVPLQLGGGPGLSALFIDRDGTPWTGRGDGAVASLDPATGAQRVSASLAQSPIKGIAGYRRGGRVLAVPTTGALAELDQALAVQRRWEIVGGRRLARVGDSLLVLSYDDHQWSLDPVADDLHKVNLGVRSWFDIGVTPDGRAAAALGDDGAVWVIDDADPGAARKVGVARSATAVTRLTDGRVVLGGSGELTLLGAGGEARRIAHPAVAVLDLASSPDDRLLATGGRDGVIRVFDVPSGALVAVLEGHRERVSAVVWSGPTSLWSASWDGTVRRWELSVLDAEPLDLAAEVEGAWGLTVEDALAASAR